jgi:hypothetical protein
MSLAKHVAVVAFVAAAITASRINWDYVNRHAGDSNVLAVVSAQFVAAFLVWGVLWAVGVLIWRGLRASFRRSGATR